MWHLPKADPGAGQEQIHSSIEEVSTNRVCPIEPSCSIKPEPLSERKDKEHVADVESVYMQLNGEINEKRQADGEGDADHTHGKQSKCKRISIGKYC